MKTWNLKTPGRHPVTDSDVMRLNAYMALIEAKNKMEQAIMKLDEAEGADNISIARQLKIRGERRKALITLQEIHNEIRNFDL